MAPNTVSVPLIAPGDIHQQLWSAFRRTGDPEIRQQIASLYLDLVHALAGQVARGLPPCVDVSDLVQEGYLGLHRAIGSFDLSFNVKFTTYASTAIRGAMLDSLRRTAWAPRGARQRAGEIEHARMELMGTLERPPTDEEVAGRLGISMVEYERISEDAQVASQVSLWSGEGRRSWSPRSSSWGSSTGGRSSKPAIPPDERVEDPAMAAQRQDLRELLLKGFDRAERLIVILYYFERMTMKEIGETLGMSESRVSQKHALIVDRIKASLSGRLKELT
jgi:RNA polymerase sigma factor for flagellar operon FliA